jgi:dTDP-4-dehydrorhamnose reductase
MNDPVIVFGANGMLGRAVVRFFAARGDAVTAVTRANYDIARDGFAALRRVVGDAGVIVNCAGVIKPMIASTAIEDVLRVNAVFPHNLALAAPAARVFHVTTDCVYTGADGGYDENAPVDAEDVYGLSKAGGDSAPAMVLRTSIVGEEEPPGRSLLAWAISQRGQTVNGFTNHRWNGVTTLELARLIGAIVDDDAYEVGRFHVHSPQVHTKDEMLRLFDEVYELNLNVVPKAAAEPCDRSLRSVRSLGARYGTPPFRDQLARMRAFFAQPVPLVT